MMAWLNRLWQRETCGVTSAAIVISVAGLMSRVLGLVRDRLLATQFGAGVELDAYYAAFRLPDFLFNLLILGALTAGFIPVFTEYLERRDKDEAWRLAEDVLSVVGTLLAVMCAILALGAAWVIPLITPGFEDEKLRLTVGLARIMFLSPVLLGLSAIMGGVLQSMRRFLAFSIAPILYNVGIIFGIAVLSRWMGIRGVAWGVVIGAGLHLAAQAHVVRCLGVRRLRWPSFSSQGVRRIIRLMLPRTAGLAVTQFNLVVLLALASSLEPGSIAVFHLANNLQSVPIGLVAVPFAIAAFPAMSRAMGMQDQADFLAALSHALRKIVFFILPLTGFILLLRVQIVRLILGDGKFDWDDTIRTTSVLGWFTVSLIAQALIPLFARAFYARQNTWTPFWAGVVGETANVAAALILRKPYGIAGLAMAFSLAAFIQLSWLSVAFHFRCGTFSRGTLRLSFLKTILATMSALVVGYGFRQWIGTAYPLVQAWQVALQAGLAAAGGGIVFFLSARLMRSQELQELLDGARRKWRGWFVVSS